MSADNGGDPAEAAEVLRDARRELAQDELREAVQTGGGLSVGGAMSIGQAIRILGRFRAEDILGVEVPDGGPPGEQASLPGTESFPGESESSAAPPPRGQEATFSDFANGGNGDSGNR